MPTLPPSLQMTNSDDTSPSVPSHSTPNSCSLDSTVSTVPNDSFTSVAVLYNTEVHTDRKKQGNFAEGGIRSTGKFLDAELPIPLLTSIDTPLREIPRGKEDNMIFQVSNSVNTVRVAKGKTSIFIDDCRAWTGYISSKTIYYMDV
ncbi:hypothetical protein BaRGS_00009722 [Batillaria attramentaria]|uniref:Uncharacterized protein n=1 Tax=Batillaria attramentaria TaxID=370345 RepID=A0ABD0LI74_9CAEN